MPSAAALCISAMGKCRASSQATAFGANTSSAKLRAMSRTAIWSSSRANCGDARGEGSSMNQPSVAVALGHRLFGAKIGGRGRISAKPMPVTSRPAAITTIRLGSQVPLAMPNTSRKPKTFVVCTMWEITRPEPKMKPQSRLASAGMALASDDVMRQRDDDHRRDHEYDCRRDRARRQPRNAADAVAGGAAVAEPGAEADQQ